MNTAKFPSFPSDTARNYVSLHLKSVDVSVLKRSNEYGRSTCKNMEYEMCVFVRFMFTVRVCVCVRCFNALMFAPFCGFKCKCHRG